METEMELTEAEKELVIRDRFARVFQPLVKVMIDGKMTEEERGAFLEGLGVMNHLTEEADRWAMARIFRILAQGLANRTRRAA